VVVHHFKIKVKSDVNIDSSINVFGYLLTGDRIESALRFDKALSFRETPRELKIG
jgi:hypothetical protein